MITIRSLIFILFLAIFIPEAVSGIDAQQARLDAASPLLDRIAIGEGATDEAAQEHGLSSAYDITYAYGIYNPKDSKPLTEMTIGEVKLLQQQMLASQAGNEIISSAVGKYQLISSTLKEQQKTLGLSDDFVFDAATQDLFGLSLLEKRGYNDWIEGTISDDQFQKNLAKEWASIADPDTGMSYYGQRVGTTSTQIKEAMAQARSLLATRTPQIGDHVTIITTDPNWWVKGEITDIGDGLICLYATDSHYINSPGDVCVGVGSIVELDWI